jgi:Kef-type K+ transport system membrane component KefB
MNTFIEISLIFVVATLIAGLMRVLKQPLIIGYILTGLIIGPYLFNVLHSDEILQTFSEFGIALLLFIVGLHLNPKVIKEVGKASLTAGLGHIIFTTIAGSALSLLLGFSVLESLFLGISLTFSSTIIVLKLLSDKKDIDKLYSKIAIGFLILQDIIAAFLLVFISAVSKGQMDITVITDLLAKILGLAIGLSIIYKIILPRLTEFLSRSQEFLFLFALGWGLGIASIFSVLGFSPEIGALIAGIILSLFPFNVEIGSKMRPIRDFFLIIFFILLGSRLDIYQIDVLIIPALILSGFVILINPLIVMILMGILGYKKRLGFLTGLTMTQISEFSLVLVAIGVNVKMLSESLLSLVTLVGIITITVSSYLILHSGQIYYILSPYLKIFEKRSAKAKKDINTGYEAILFGCNRLGFDFLEVFEKLKTKYLIVDFDPDIIKELMKDNIYCIYGDVDDSELIEELNIENAKIIVSTIPEYDTNIFLVKTIMKRNPNCIILTRSHDIEDSFKLYEAGATYVIMPHFLGGEYASNLINLNGYDIQKYKKEGKKHLKELDKRIFLGHEHPSITKN